MANDRAQHGSVPSRRQRHKHALLGGVCALAVALALGSSPAAAKDKTSDKHKSAEHNNKEPFGNIPKGPLQIFISINQQKLHLYSDGTHVADAMVATGMPGHATPMGLFDIIDKDRFHHSNIYSGAPMPYMQRITWSGVALHEGVGLGHPASHGCIRMPHEFAARLWVLSKLGMRVVIARQELKPSDFADSHLFVHKEPPAPAPTASSEVEPVKTAQATDSGIATDAIGSQKPATPTTEVRQSNPVAVDLDPAHAVQPAAIGIAAGDADPTMASDVTPDTKDAIASAPGQSDPQAAEASKPETPQQPGVDTPATSTAQEIQSAAHGKGAAGEIGVTTPMASDADAAAAVTDTDPVPVPLPKPGALVKAQAAKAAAPIAIFVSRRTSKIYVRQNFSPLFSAPITIDHPEQPLGTHLFSALDFQDDKSTLRWNEVSLSAEQPKPARHSESEKRSERNAKEKRKAEVVAKPTPPPTTAAEALARIEIPPDVIEQISELIVPGSSLIVSDQGLGEETGQYTDFIVVTR